MFAIACSPAKREPVGVSNGGRDRDRVVDAGLADAPMLEGLPADFRASWKRVGDHIASEHGRFVADVYQGDASFAEDLFVADAGAGVYLIARASDGGVRYGVADVRGHLVAEGVELCARCHRDAPHDAIFPY